MSKTTKNAAPRARKSTPDAPVSEPAATDAHNASGATTDAPATPTADPKADGKPAKKAKAPKEDLVVFAFRLTPAERDAIHKAAGPAKASRFVRALCVHAAQGDAETVRKMAEAVAADAK